MLPSPVKEGRLPNFLIVGAAKCGTTSLSRYLREHPQVFIPPAKELYFFERDDLWELGTDWYAEQFADAGDAVAVGEATPDYMFFEHSVRRIGQTLPGVRAIACLREPVARAHSHYLHWFEDEARDARSFERAMRDELAAGGTEEARDRRRGRPPYFGYLARGRYLPQLERLAAALGRENVHVVLLDDIEHDPAATYAGVCRFLGVDDGFVPESLGQRFNVYHQWRPPWLWRFMVRHHVFRLLPKRLGAHVALNVMGTKAVPPPPMDPQLRAELVEFYAADNAALARWLGRDLGAWSG